LDYIVVHDVAFEGKVFDKHRTFDQMAEKIIDDLSYV
jgi:hypothetical protein